MRLASAANRGGHSAIALLAALALWLQVIVPAIGTTVHLVVAGHHHGGHSTSIDHARHTGASQPAAPKQEHNHLGLCCIIGGGKLGTGFAPPPATQVVFAHQSVSAIIALRPDHVAPPPARNSILPVGARAPPWFS